MEVSALGGATGGLTSAVADNTLGQDAFLQLLVTQLRYQDPLSPMENEAFIAQLAQFSSLEQMQQLNTNVETSIQLDQSQANSAATYMIGKEVRAAGDELIVGETNEPEFGYYLPDGAGAVQVTIYDSAGQVVRSLAFAQPDTGSNIQTWDGRDASGTRVEPGSYRVEVEASNADGSAAAATTTVTGHVDGVTFQNGQAWLLVEGREVPLASVLEVFEATTPEDPTE